jgi:hypothetical protein
LKAEAVRLFAIEIQEEDHGDVARGLKQKDGLVRVRGLQNFESGFLDSVIRRFESFRPSQLLANEIKHLLKSLGLYFDVRPRLEFSRPRQENEKLHHTSPLSRS